MQNLIFDCEGYFYVVTFKKVGEPKRKIFYKRLPDIDGLNSAGSREEIGGVFRDFFFMV